MTIKEFRERFFSYIEAADSIIITSHVSPDDDSIGSVLLTRSIVAAKFPNKKVRIVYTGARISRYKVFADFEIIEWVDDIADHLEGIDVLITLDASNWRRFSKQEKKIADVPIRIGLDHHASDSDEYTLLLKAEEYSSNVELVYRTFLEHDKISKVQAQYILLGVLGDTGNFAYLAPSQTEVLSLTKTLIETVGESIGEFRSRYGGIPKQVIPLIQTLVKNTLYIEIDGWPPGQYTFIERAVMLEGNQTDEDMSAASHLYMQQYLPRIESYNWGFVVTPRADGGCRMSGRSLPGSVNVRDLHERLGIGSGHDRASGGYWREGDPKECIAKVIEWMHSNRPVIQ